MKLKAIILALMLVFTQMQDIIALPKTADCVVLWEKNELIKTGQSAVFVPEIIEYQNKIYANYGDVLYVFSKNDGTLLQRYEPYCYSKFYTILDIEIHENAIYAYMIETHSIPESHSRYNLIKLDIVSFDILWMIKSPSIVNFLLIDKFVYQYSLPYGFFVIDKNDGKFLGSVMPDISDFDFSCLLKASYNKELNQVWIYFYKEKNEEEPYQHLHIERFDPNLCQFISPIEIKCDTSPRITICDDNFSPKLHKGNFLFAVLHKDSYDYLIKINTRTLFIEWVIKTDKYIYEVFADLSNKKVIYIRQDLDLFTEINMFSGTINKTWKIPNFEHNFYPYSRSSCLDGIIASRFVSHLLVFDLHSGKAIWVKKSDRPDRYRGVVGIGFSTPKIECFDKNTYQILFSLEDSIGLLKLKYLE